MYLESVVINTYIAISYLSKLGESYISRSLLIILSV